MDETTITGLPLANGIDASADWFAIDRTSLNTTQRINRNTILGILGSPVGTTDSQTLTNKVLTLPTITILDNALTIQDNLDATKQLQFQLSGITTATTRTLTVPNANTTIVGTDATQTLTNKTLTSPTINGGTISNATVNVDTISGFTTPNNGTVYGLAVTSGQIGTAGIATGAVTTAKIASSAVDYTKVSTGFAIQVVSSLVSTSATGTGTIPFDTSIPQITEGDQYMTVAITPKSATSTLVIEAHAMLANNQAGNNITMALFQDATANALAAVSGRLVTADTSLTLFLRHVMTAGTTSPTTFRIRAAGNAAGTTTFAGVAGANQLGTIPKASILVTEYKA